MQVQFNGQPKIEPIPGSYPKIRVTAWLNFSKSPSTEPPAMLLDMIPRLDLAGVTLPQIIEENYLSIGEDVTQPGHRQISWLAPLSRDIIERIEATRIDDVAVQVSIQTRYLALAPGQSPPIRPGRTDASSAFELSQSKWLALLDKTGYFASWILEVRRPAIEGWNQAVGFLNKAEERILAKDPEAPWPNAGRRGRASRLQ